MAESIFGGVYGDRVSTELTAVPIALEKGAKLSSTTDIEGWFWVDDETGLGILRVVTPVDHAQGCAVVRPGQQKDRMTQAG